MGLNLQGLGYTVSARTSQFNAGVGKMSQRLLGVEGQLGQVQAAADKAGQALTKLGVVDVAPKVTGPQAGPQSIGNLRIRDATTGRFKSAVGEVKSTGPMDSGGGGFGMPGLPGLSGAKVLDAIRSGGNRAWDTMAKLASVTGTVATRFKDLGKSAGAKTFDVISKGAGMAGKAMAGIKGLGGRVAGAAGKALGGLTSTQLNLPGGEDMTKSLTKQAVNFGKAGKDIRKFVTEGASLATSLGIDADGAGKAIGAYQASMAEFKALGFDTAASVAKMADVFDVNVVDFGKLLTRQRKEFQLTDKGLKSINSSIYLYGKQVGDVSGALQKGDDVIKSLSDVTDVRTGQKVKGDALVKSAQSTMQLASALATFDPAGALDSALEFSKLLTESSDAMTGLMTGFKDGLPDMMGPLNQMGLSVHDIMGMMAEGPAGFVKALGTVQARAKATGVDASKVTVVMGQALKKIGPAGDRIAELLKNDTAMQTLEQAFASEGTLLRKAVDEGFVRAGSGGDLLSAAEDRFKRRLFGIVRTDINKFIKGTEAAYDGLGSKVEKLAADKGPLGEITRKFLLIHHIGAKALLPESLQPIAHLMGSMWQTLIPTLTALGTMGFQFGILASPIALVGGALAVVAIRVGDLVLKGKSAAEILTTLRADVERVTLAVLLFGDKALSKMVGWTDRLQGWTKKLDFSGMFKSMKSALTGSGAAGVVQWVKDFAGDLVGGFVDVISGRDPKSKTRLGGIITGLLASLRNVFVGVAKGWQESGIGEALLSTLKSGLRWTFDTMSKMPVASWVEQAAGLLVRVFRGAVGLVSSLVASLPLTELGRAWLGSIGARLNMAFKLLGTLPIGDMAQEVVNLMARLGVKITGAAGKMLAATPVVIVRPLLEGLSSAWGMLVEYVDSGKLYALADSILRFFEQGFDDVYKGVRGFVVNLWTVASAKVRSIDWGSLLRTVANILINVLPSLAGRVWRGLVGMYMTIHNGLVDLIAGGVRVVTDFLSRGEWLNVVKSLPATIGPYLVEGAKKLVDFMGGVIVGFGGWMWNLAGKILGMAGAVLKNLPRILFNVVKGLSLTLGSAVMIALPMAEAALRSFSAQLAKIWEATWPALQDSATMFFREYGMAIKRSIVAVLEIFEKLPQTDALLVKTGLKGFMEDVRAEDRKAAHWAAVYEENQKKREAALLASKPSGKIEMFDGVDFKMPEFNLGMSDLGGPPAKGADRLTGSLGGVASKGAEAASAVGKFVAAIGAGKGLAGALEATKTQADGFLGAFGADGGEASDLFGGLGTGATKAADGVKILGTSFRDETAVVSSDFRGTTQAMLDQFAQDTRQVLKTQVAEAFRSTWSDVLVTSKDKFFSPLESRWEAMNTRLTQTFERTLIRLLEEMTLTVKAIYADTDSVMSEIRRVTSAAETARALKAAEATKATGSANTAAVASLAGDLRVLGEATHWPAWWFEYRALYKAEMAALRAQVASGGAGAGPVPKGAPPAVASERAGTAMRRGALPPAAPL